jgi:hypothetical protein
MRLGTYIINRRTNPIPIRYGAVARVTLPTGTPVMALRMNKHSPKGGVRTPIIRASVMTTPKWRVEIP